jgi:hypothetical protein
MISEGLSEIGKLPAWHVYPAHVFAQHKNREQAGLKPLAGSMHGTSSLWIIVDSRGLATWACLWSCAATAIDAAGLGRKGLAHRACAYFHLDAHLRIRVHICNRETRRPDVTRLTKGNSPGLRSVPVGGITHLKNSFTGQVIPAALHVMGTAWQHCSVEHPMVRSHSIVSGLGTGAVPRGHVCPVGNGHSVLCAMAGHFGLQCTIHLRLSLLFWALESSNIALGNVRTNRHTPSYI